MMEVNFQKYEDYLCISPLALLLFETFPSIKKLGYRKMNLYIQEKLN